MNSLFSTLSTWLTASPLLAFASAFLWGIFSVILSPCHLAAIPLVMAYIAENSERNVKRAFYISLLFSVGILVSNVVIGIVTVSLGRLIGDVGSFGNYFMAALFMIIGLVFLDCIVLNWNMLSASSKKAKKTLWGSFILGVLIGVGLGPCTFAYIAPLMGIISSISISEWYVATLTVLLFALGHSLVIVLAGTFSEFIYKYLQWNENSHAIEIFRKICGFLFILIGFYYLFK